VEWEERNEVEWEERNEVEWEERNEVEWEERNEVEWERIIERSTLAECPSPIIFKNSSHSKIASLIHFSTI
jgi:hypothetical protein